MIETGSCAIGAAHCRDSSLAAVCASSNQHSAAVAPVRKGELRVRRWPRIAASCLGLLSVRDRRDRRIAVPSRRRGRALSGIRVFSRGLASPAIRAPMCTASPPMSSQRNSHSPACSPALMSTPRSGSRRGEPRRNGLRAQDLRIPPASGRRGSLDARAETPARSSQALTEPPAQATPRQPRTPERSGRTRNSDHLAMLATHPRTDATAPNAPVTRLLLHAIPEARTATCHSFRPGRAAPLSGG
jgi:hypothetical protein